MIEHIVNQNSPQIINSQPVTFTIGLHRVIKALIDAVRDSV